jgi:ubiquinone/menaquinone biosynthesis C-methylase UbiE
VRKFLIAFTALALVAGAAVAAGSLPYLPIIHGTSEDEVERAAEWLELKTGTDVADFGAGDGTFAVAFARRVGDSSDVLATELDDDQLTEIRETAREAGVQNVTAIKGEVADTSLPEACCDAIFSRHVYHHLSDSPAINKHLFRALRPGGRLLVVDFEPGGIMDWLGHAESRHGGHGTPKGTVVKELTAAGFELVREPESWRGRTYGVLFKRP